MKKINLIVFIFLFFFLFFTSSSLVNAAGQVCCPDIGYYDPDSNSCTWTVPNQPKHSKPTACGAGETCVGSGKGICSESNQASECCPDIGYYDPDSGNCVWTVPGHGEQSKPTACGADQWCSTRGGRKGLCISGTEPEEKTITLLKPVCCSGAQVCDAYDEWGNCTQEHCSHIETALGCFPTQPKQIIEWVLKYAIMFAGGIGFLLMLFASFQIMTSAGDPDKLKAGQQLLGSVIAGILFIVFALFLLRFIGFTVLKIPGWQ